MNEELITEKLNNIEKKLDEIVQQAKERDLKVEVIVEKHEERLNVILLRLEKNESYIKGSIGGFGLIFGALLIMMYAIYQSDKTTSIESDRITYQQLNVIKEHERMTDDRLFKLELENKK